VAWRGAGTDLLAARRQDLRASELGGRPGSGLAGGPVAFLFFNRFSQAGEKYVYKKMINAVILSKADMMPASKNQNWPPAKSGFAVVYVAFAIHLGIHYI